MTDRAKELVELFKDAPFVQAQGCMSGCRPFTFGGCPFCGSQSCVAGECRSPNSDIALFRPVVDKPLDVTRNDDTIEPSTQHTGETK